MRLAVCAILFISAVFLPGKVTATDLGLDFTATAPKRVNVADSVVFSWTMAGPFAELRYKLDTPVIGNTASDTRSINGRTGGWKNGSSSAVSLWRGTTG